MSATTIENRIVAGLMANQVAEQAVFADYSSRLADNTLRRQARDLECMADYLSSATGEDLGDLAASPAAWAGVTWGWVRAWRDWMAGQGYAAGTINQRLSTIRAYAALANQAGALSAEELIKIRGVRGYPRHEALRMDQKRARAGAPTRIGDKKASPVVPTPEQIGRLKNQPDTPQGRRDQLLMCLLLDHGLRCGEVALLRVESFQRGKLTFYRPKVSKTQTHRLSADTSVALAAYLMRDQRAKIGPLLMGSRRGGGLAGTMGERSITARVDVLGEAVGVVGLSAHDCRHDWATRAARNGTPLDRLRDAGGWASLAMPARYIEDAAVANDGVRIDE